MTMNRVNTVLAALGGLFLLYIGIGYIFAPEAMAEGFGLQAWPEDQGNGFLQVKGDRDIALGLVVFALLLSGQRKALGLAMVAMVFAPASDMLLVLNDGGSAAVAFGVHGFAAAICAVTGGLLLRERPSTA